MRISMENYGFEFRKEFIQLCKLLKDEEISIHEGFALIYTYFEKYTDTHELSTYNVFDTVECIAQRICTNNNISIHWEDCEDQDTAYYLHQILTVFIELSERCYVTKNGSISFNDDYIDTNDVIIIINDIKTLYDSCIALGIYSEDFTTPKVFVNIIDDTRWRDLVLKIL